MRSEAVTPNIGRYLAVETAVSIAINIALAGLFTWLMFGSGEMTMWGPGDLALDFLPATFLPVFAMTAGLTIFTRKRRREGKSPSIPAPALPLPSSPFVRGIAFGLAALVLLASPGLAMLAAIWSPELPFAAVLSFKLAYGGLIGLIVTPPIVIAALRDPLRSR